MSWFSTGAEAADQVAASMITKRRRNFFTKAGESAVIRFLSPATQSFNYKRAFVKWAKGEKMLTSPQTVPDPFVEAGLQLQAAFAWVILDRRILEIKDQTTGETKEIGPRVLYFADGQRTRKQLIAFEKEMLISENEDRAENGLEPLTAEEFNLTSYDLKVSKDAKAPWNFVAKRAKELSAKDKELVEKAGDGQDLLNVEVQKNWLMEELKPLPMPELNALLKGAATQQANGAVDDDDATTAYSYSSDNDDTIKFDE